KHKEESLSWLKYENSPAVKRTCNPYLFILSFQQLVGEPINVEMHLHHPCQAAADNLWRFGCFNNTNSPVTMNYELS
ncbi:MAG: hypothetical protein QNK14_00665, partial [Desulfobacterales bacterium]|nr:hypothetical protein [Desulfobacterales bacterium]